MGDRGEQRAREYLERKGYRIRETQWRCKAGEIDIIAEKNGVFIFVEVKTRQGSAFGHPEEAVTATKLRHLIHAAEIYGQMHALNAPRRIDVIAITTTENGEEIRHIEDVTGGM